MALPTSRKCNQHCAIAPSQWSCWGPAGIWFRPAGGGCPACQNEMLSNSKKTGAKGRSNPKHRTRRFDNRWRTGGKPRAYLDSSAKEHAWLNRLGQRLATAREVERPIGVGRAPASVCPAGLRRRTWHTSPEETWEAIRNNFGRIIDIPGRSNQHSNEPMPFV